MTSSKLWLVVAFLGVAACSDSSPDPLAPHQPDLAPGRSGGILVANSGDDGPGSFRAAVAAANASPSIHEIEFASGLSPILLQQPVVFTGKQSLTITGSQAVIDGAALDPAAPAAFVTTGGGDLALAALTFRNAPQQGLSVEVPTDAKGNKKVSLSNVTAIGNSGHGVLINDQTDPEDVENTGGSDASLEVSVTGSRFADNGFGALDRDGLRINEGGKGGLTLVMALTRAEGNGADGVELDERGPGDVRFGVSTSQFTENGSFDQTLEDLDDGFDVDESNEGSLIGSVALSSANDNKEEGFDFNENAAGDFRVDMTLSEASRNLQEGIDFEEDDDVQGGGDLVTTLVGIKANGNGPDGDAGLKIRERGDGDVDATVRGAETIGNSIGGINVREDADGSLGVFIDQPTADGNGEDGVALDENGAGNLAATIQNGSASDNGGAGVRAEQELPGTGELTLVTMALTGNTDGAIVSSGVTVAPTP